MFFDGVPSSMYTVESELPATVIVTVILLPSTVIVLRAAVVLGSGSTSFEIIRQASNSGLRVAGAKLTGN